MYGSSADRGALGGKTIFKVILPQKDQGVNRQLCISEKTQDSSTENQYDDRAQRVHCAGKMGAGEYFIGSLRFLELEENISGR